MAYAAPEAPPHPGRHGRRSSTAGTSRIDRPSLRRRRRSRSSRGSCGALTARSRSTAGRSGGRVTFLHGQEAAPPAAVTGRRPQRGRRMCRRRGVRLRRGDRAVALTATARPADLREPLRCPRGGFLVEGSCGCTARRGVELSLGSLGLGGQLGDLAAGLRRAQSHAEVEPCGRARLDGRARQQRVRRRGLPAARSARRTHDGQER